MMTIKRIFKQNSHNTFFRILAGFGRSLNRFYENRNHDIQSNGELTILKKIAKLNPKVIIDGGANIGDYSLLASDLNSECQIYSFEPVSSTFQILNENVKNYKNIHPVRKGFYSENCSKEINVFNSNEHASIIEIQGLNYRSNEKQIIELIRGDDFMKNNQIDSIDLLKLDIEGAEYDALLGFENNIRNGKIKAIQFEYGYINISTKKLLIDYYNFFESNNYIIGKIFPKTVEFRKYDFKYEDFIGPNYIAINKSETQLIELLSEK